MPARFASARLAAAALAAVLAAIPLHGGASAADLYGEGYYPPPDAGPPAEYPYAERGSRDRYDDEDAWVDEDRGPPRDAYADRRPPPDRYAPPPPPPPAYAYRAPAGGYAERYAPGPACVAPARIRARLAGEGWTGFRLVRQRPDLVVLRARRVESGRVFTLRIEPCRGTIVDARPYFLRTFGDYQPSRRWAYWGRPY